MEGLLTSGMEVEVEGQKPEGPQTHIGEKHILHGEQGDHDTVHKFPLVVVHLHVFIDMPAFPSAVFSDLRVCSNSAIWMRLLVVTRLSLNSGSPSTPVGMHGVVGLLNFCAAFEDLERRLSLHAHDLQVRVQPDMAEVVTCPTLTSRRREEQFTWRAQSKQTTDPFPS